MDTHDFTTPLKRCSKCGRELPATRDYFHVDAKRKNGLNSACKACRCARQSERYRDNSDALKEYQRQYRAENHDAVLEKKRQYRLDNLTKVRDQERTVREKHKSARRERRRSEYWKNREVERERCRRSYQKYKAKRQQNQREYYVENQDSILEYQRYYRQQNREIRKVQGIRRRAAKLTLPNTFSSRDWELAVAFFEGKCAVCGRPIGLWHTLAADHWIPLTSPDCPGTVPWNIVPLCHGIDGCNNSKYNRDAAQWLAQKYGKRRGMKILRRIELFLESRRTDDV